MILSASYRTDIPAFYGAWFAGRLAAGYCEVKNPYSGAPSRVSLRPEDCEGLVFWTRNAAPFQPVLEGLKAQARPFYVQFTALGYPRALDPSVIPLENAIDQIQKLSSQFGVDAVVWRYDPVVFSGLTPPEWHIRRFRRLAAQLRGYITEVVVSFMHPYRKTQRNLTVAAKQHGFAWRDPPIEEKAALLQKLAGLAEEQGMTPRLCAQPELDNKGALPAACIDAERLSRIAGHPIPAPLQGNRPGCLCAAARDIGAYDSCLHGCRYCYAVGRHDRAAQQFRRHNPAATGLL